MNLLLLNFTVDLDDDALAFTWSWVRALAARCDHVDVITMSARRHDPLPNVTVHSLGKERGAGRGRQVATFYRHMRRILRARKIDACFTHMHHKMAILAAPVLAMRGIPMTLWYTHRATPPSLRLAARLSRRIVTSAPDSFRLPHPDIVVTGHGIDTSLFSPANQPGEAARPFTIAMLALLRPIKRVDVVIEAAAILRDDTAMPPFQFKIAGPFAPDTDAYQARLTDLLRAHDLADRVAFLGKVPFNEAPSIYRQSDAFVNLSPTGLFDKAVLEAMSCAVPAIVSNPAFADLHGRWTDQLLVPDDTPEALARLLKTLALMPQDRRAEMGADLRKAVIAAHDLDRLSGKLVALMGE